MSDYQQIYTESVVGFDIVFSITPEYMEPDWDFESEEDKQDTLNKINSGQLAYFVARVDCFKNGICLATNYLGGCCYDSPMQFVEESDYYADMVETVVNEARQAITKLCQSL